jgi:hypothetical protein
MLWIGIGAGIIGLAVVFFSRRVSNPDLGSVSSRWIAEHRADRVDDSSR